MNKYIFFLGISLSLVSCADLQRNEQIKQLTEIEKSLDSIQTVLIEVYDVEKFENVLDLNDDLSRKIRAKQDTISLEFAFVLDEYNHIFTNKSGVNNLFLAIDSNVVLQKKSINFLKSDINNGEGKRGDYNDFIQFEQQKVQTLRNDLTTFIQLYNPFIEMHEKYYMQIDSFYNLTQ